MSAIKSIEAKNEVELLQILDPAYGKFAKSSYMNFAYRGYAGSHYDLQPTAFRDNAILLTLNRPGIVGGCFV